MERLQHFKAKLKAAQAEGVSRVKEYNQAMRALARTAKEVIDLKKKVEEYEARNLAKIK